MPLMSGRIAALHVPVPFVLGPRLVGTSSYQNVACQYRGSSLRQIGAANAPYGDGNGNDLGSWGPGACAWNKGQNLLVTVRTGLSPFQICAVSSDRGVTWSTITMTPSFLDPSAGQWIGYSVACTPDGSAIVMTGQEGDGGTNSVGDGNVLVSFDHGSTWASISLPNGVYLKEPTHPAYGRRYGQVTYCTRLKKFFIGGSGTGTSAPPLLDPLLADAILPCGAIWASSDGSTWSLVLETPGVFLPRLHPEFDYGAEMYRLRGVASDQKRGLLAFGWRRHDDNSQAGLRNYLLAYYSTDGVTWSLANGGYSLTALQGLSAPTAIDFTSMAGDGRGNWCVAGNSVYFPGTGSVRGGNSSWRTTDNGQSWIDGLDAFGGGPNSGNIKLAAMGDYIFGAQYGAGLAGFSETAPILARTRSGGMVWRTMPPEAQPIARPKAIATW